MHILAGLDTPTSGEVTVAGVDIAGLGDDDLTKLRRDHIGFIFQFFNLLPMLTAAENIALPLKLAGVKPDRAWLDQVVESVGLTDRLKHRPSELSGGQQQRVAVARALVSRPTVMFADEPTGNLDSRTSGEILELLRDAVDTLGQTTVMVTHDAHAAAIADRVLFLADGDIVRDLGPSTAHEILETLEAVIGSMIAVALKGLAGRKVRALLTAFAIVIGVVDGRRHVHPHRHHCRVADELSRASRRRRPTSRSSRRRSSRARQRQPRSRSRPRCWRRSGRCRRSPTPPARSRRRWRPTSPTSSAVTASPPRPELRPRLRPRASAARAHQRRRVQPVQARVQRRLARRAPGRSSSTPHRRQAALQGRRHDRDRDRPARHRFKLTGTVSFLGEELPPRPSVAAWDIKTAQTVLDRAGRYDVISIAPRPASHRSELAARGQAAAARRT